MAGVMKQIKKPHKKVPISPSELCRVSLVCLACCLFILSVELLSQFFHESPAGEMIDTKAIVAGDRPDNQWLQYNSGKLPLTQKDWDACVFVEKTHWGYYCWPRFLI